MMISKFITSILEMPSPGNDFAMVLSQGFLKPLTLPLPGGGRGRADPPKVFLL